MDYIVDPRRDLPPPTIQPSSYYSHAALSLSNLRHRRFNSYNVPPKKPKKKLCHDWIFSTASNAHVAIDRAAFKTYTHFRTYVLTVADQREVAVQGIGTVEIKIRKAPGTREGHTIMLQDVLHVPDWLCNIVSDIIFTPEKDYDHTWTQVGVNFFNVEGDRAKPWGFTEDFCGLDRLVLSKSLSGRSPMLDDPDREVFSVSVTWPQGQRDKWEENSATQLTQLGGKPDELLIEKKQPRGIESNKTSLYDHDQSEDEDEDTSFYLTKPLRRHVKSLENTTWKVMPDLSAISAHMKRHSKSRLFELEGNCNFLNRVSSLNFNNQQAQE